MFSSKKSKKFLSIPDCTVILMFYSRNLILLVFLLASMIHNQVIYIECIKLLI